MMLTAERRELVTGRDPTPTPELVTLVEKLMSGRIVDWRAPTGGYSPAERWIVRSADGKSAFVKAATCEQTACWLRIEAAVYEAIDAPFLARVLAFESAELPVLLLEDLSAGSWPPPWSETDVHHVVETVCSFADVVVPASFPSQEEIIARSGGGKRPWDVVARDPVPFLALRLCSPAWLDRALPAFLDAQDALIFRGEALVHNDVRSDNICLSGRGVIIIDWNWAARGHPSYDLSRWAASLVVEGGTLPGEVAAAVPEFAVWHAGNWGHQAPTILTARAPVASLKLAQLRVALDLAAHALDLPPPDPPFEGGGRGLT
jgi:hypothetical protein